MKKKKSAGKSEKTEGKKSSGKKVSLKGVKKVSKKLKVSKKPRESKKHVKKISTNKISLDKSKGGVEQGGGVEQKSPEVLKGIGFNVKSMFSKRKTDVKKMERISTGIKSFDSMIGKGFQKNSTNLVVGSAGSGKTIFAMQFLIEGMKKNEKCLYISFDEEKDSFYANMKEIGWDLDKYESQGKFFFLEYTPQKVKIMLEEGGGIIENLVLSKKITRIAIDSITSFLFLFKNEIQEREASLALINLLRKWDTTTIITYEGDPSRERKTVLKTSSRILELESDSIVLFYFLRNKNQRSRYLEILKIKGIKHPTGIYPFTIEKDGIKISSRAYSGELGV